MASIFGSLFENGHWEWDDILHRLYFVSSVAVAKKKRTLKQVEAQPKNLRVYLDMQFADTMDPKEMATFRRVFLRRVGATEVDVVRVQDVRDVVMYQCSSMLPNDIIDLLHLEAVERFVRALILYMQFFLQVMDALHERAPDREQRLTLGDLTHVERAWQRDLMDLRTLVAREHCCLLMAADRRTVNFHHLTGGLSSTGSKGERDIRYYEMLWRFAARMVYVALYRRSFSLIEGEMNRLFRSRVFSAHIKRPQRNKNKAFEIPTAPRRSAAISLTVNKPKSYEYRTLYGEAEEERRIFHTHAPACMTALADNDYRLMATGNIDFVGDDERLLKLWQALTLPEEMIAGSGVVLGILGLPRPAFDCMLTPLNKLTVEEEKDDMERMGSSNMSTIAVDETQPILVETPTQEVMELPPPGPSMPAPSIFPRTRADYGLLLDEVGRPRGKSIIKLRESAAKDRLKSRQRWRRWEMGNMRSRRRMSSPNPAAVAAAVASMGVTAEPIVDQAIKIAEGLLDDSGSGGTPTKPRKPVVDFSCESEGMEESTEDEIQDWEEDDEN